jgi:hypothetical protein
MQISLSELEARLAMERCVDIFTMQPKVRLTAPTCAEPG